MKINQLLKNPEGKKLEFKRDFSSPVNILKTICAFSNTAGGTLLIGVEDKTRYVKGIEQPLELEERIINTVNDSIDPLIIPDIDIIPWRDTYILAIHVYPSPYKAHFLKKFGPETGTYIRIGSTNRLADSAVRKELARIAHNESYDEQAVPHLSSEELDFRATSEQFKEIKILKKSDLTSLNLLTQYQNRTVPTVAGMLLFGKNRLQTFPDAWIQVGRFRGKDKSKILDSAALEDHLIQAIYNAISFVERHTINQIEVGRVTHQQKRGFPMLALREIMINAVVHADYSQTGSPIRVSIFDDRLEIENPGLLYYGLSVSDIKNGISKLRNRTLGKIFKTLGLIEQWGSGIQRAIKTCHEGGFPEPIFEEIGTHFRVTLYLNANRKPAVDAIDTKIIHLLSKDQEQGLTTSEIAKGIKLSPRATRTRLIKLINSGIIIEIASSAQDPNRLYFLAERTS